MGQKSQKISKTTDRTDCTDMQNNSFHLKDFSLNTFFLPGGNNSDFTMKIMNAMKQEIRFLV